MNPTLPINKSVEATAQSVQTKQPQRNKFLELQQNSNRSKNIMKPKTNRTFIREIHPHAELIENLQLPIKEMYTEFFDEPKFLERSLQNVPLHFVDTEEALKQMYSKLKGEKIIAVDLEHHSFHSYTGLVSLIQISISNEDFLVDPIRLREVLQSPELSLNWVLADESILKVFHGAESDIAWLQRDFDTFVVNMFDSYHAAKVLNLPRMSLAYLLDEFCGVELDKTYQLADWRERPLSKEMIEYARKDTHYLVHLYHLLKRKLTEDQYAQVLDRSNKQCLEMYSLDPITEKSWKIVLDRSNFALNAEQVATVRRLFYWREWKAKELDVSPPSLMPNSYLAKIAHSRASSVPELKACLRNLSEMMVKELPALAKFLQSNESKESEITGIPVSENFAESQVKIAKSSHIKFDEEAEEAEVKEKKDEFKMKPEVAVKRTCRVSFISNSESASGIFESKSTINSSKILLAGLVSQTLPGPSKEFKTKAQDEEERKEAEIADRAEAAAKKSENVVKAIVHGRNEVIEDLEIVIGNSESSVLADKLRKNIVKQNPKKELVIPVVDYTATTVESPEAVMAEVKDAIEVFDPYNTIKSEKKRAFIEANIAPANGPRLSSTRMSGNRMASFVKKRK